MIAFATMLKALAALMWPIFAFTALFLFRSQIGGLIKRIRKGKLFGQEFELGEELTKLLTSAAAANTEVTALPKDSAPIEADATDDVSKVILHEAARSPIVALMMLSRELDKQTRHALAIRGLLNARKGITVAQALSELLQYGFPPNLSGSLQLFNDVRNKIIHGGTASEDDILRAVDLGLMILNAVNSLPAEINTVFHPGVDIFSDATCNNLIANAKGVILETVSPGGAIKTFRIFPTTRTHFQRGMRVAWEWNTSQILGPAWYRDPQSGQIKQAWGSSAEFIGSHLDDI